MYELVAHEKLKTSIKESIKTLILHHKPDHKVELDKLDEAVLVLPTERRVQSQVLLKTIELTSVMKTGNEVETLLQARTLNAAVYYTRAKIAESYTSRSPQNSTLYHLLNTSLELTKTNQPDQNELVGMYSVLEKFLRQHVYKGSEPTKGYLDIQAFSINDYSAIKDILDLGKKLLEMRTEIILKAEKLYQDAKKPAESNGSLFASFFAGAPAKTSSVQGSSVSPQL
ncbi:MAG: hypothetical protein PSV35_05455 [bacterium]|nr:hypothetical protein [bacterium]